MGIPDGIFFLHPILAKNGKLSTRRRLECSQNSKESGFSSPIGSEEGKTFTWWDTDAQVFKNTIKSVRFRKVVDLNGDHTRVKYLGKVGLVVYGLLPRLSRSIAWNSLKSCWRSKDSQRVACEWIDDKIHGILRWTRNSPTLRVYVVQDWSRDWNLHFRNELSSIRVGCLWNIFFPFEKSCCL